MRNTPIRCGLRATMVVALPLIATLAGQLDNLGTIHDDGSACIRGSSPKATPLTPGGTAPASVRLLIT